MSGMRRAILPLVPLSIRPPGPGVVCLRTVQIQFTGSMSRALTPETSPIRAAVQAAKVTTLPQPRYWPWDRRTRASAREARVSQSDSARERGSSSSSSAFLYSACQPLTRAGLTVMMPSRLACSITRTSTARLFFTEERPTPSAIQP